MVNPNAIHQAPNGAPAPSDISRRKFLVDGAIAAGSVLAAGAISACAPFGGEQQTSSTLGSEVTGNPDQAPAPTANNQASATEIPAGSTMMVDFAAPTYPVDQFAIGGTISTFNGDGKTANINLSDEWKEALEALGPLAWRIPLRFNNGNPGSSAQFAQSAGDAEKYIENILEMGGKPIVVVGGDASDNDFTPEQAAGLVKFFADNGLPVTDYILGNEPTNGGSNVNYYIDTIARCAQAMRDVDPNIRLSAPALPDMKYGRGELGRVLLNAGNLLDAIGYHAYQGASAGLGATADYRTVPEELRAQYMTSEFFGDRAAQIKLALEEFNWAPDFGNRPEFYSWQNSVFFASVIGHSLSAGANAYSYADSAGPLGLMNDGSGKHNQPGKFLDRYPAYWGLAMWTGMNGQFRRFGDQVVSAASSMSGVEIFATNNGKMVLVNKTERDAQVAVSLAGVATEGVYSAWQTTKNAPLSAPVNTAENSQYTGGKMDMLLPAGSVTSAELN